MQLQINRKKDCSKSGNNLAWN